MAKSKKKPVSSAQAAREIMDVDIADGVSIGIQAAEIKDDFCPYSYEVLTGTHAGFEHSIKKAPGIIMDSLREAFAQLNVHLAVVDDVFKHAGIEIEDIDTMHNSEIAQLYTVTGIKIKGGDENASVILIGNKYLSGGSRMKLETPKIAIDELSSYKWYNELKAAVDTVCDEVKLYHYGNFTPVMEDLDEKQNPAQLSITDQQTGEETPVVDFNEGKV